VRTNAETARIIKDLGMFFDFRESNRCKPTANLETGMTGTTVQRKIVALSCGALRRGAGERLIAEGLLAERESITGRRSPGLSKKC